ncbi:MAG: hypothetical protein JWM44_2878 [Bacilli bacterium]|nr:hypothetical protein [Bacilli bacterium]
MAKKKVEPPSPPLARHFYCHKCGKGKFTLKFINHLLIRECNNCSALFDTHNLVPFVKTTIDSCLLQILNNILEKLIQSGSKTESINLFVSAESELANQSDIETAHGLLDVESSSYIPKDYAYIIGKPNNLNREFAWVSKGGK